MDDDRLAFSRNVGNVGWKRSWYHSRSRKIVCDRDLLFSLFLFHLKEEFLFAQRGPYAYKGPGGQSHPFTAHKLANTRALLHLRGRHNFPFLLFSPMPLYKISKYPKLPTCFIILLYCWSLDIRVWKIYSMNVNSWIFITIEL